MKLENRNSRVSGFRDQDVLTLQKILDEEFELEKESLIKQQREKKEQAAKQAGLQRKRMMLERQLREEISEIEKEHRIEFWLTLVSVAMLSGAKLLVKALLPKTYDLKMYSHICIVCISLREQLLSTGVPEFGSAKPPATET